MPKIGLKYLQVWIDRHGRERRYFRRDGKSIPLPSPNSSQFQKAYDAAMNGNPVLLSGKRPIKRKRYEKATDPIAPLVGVYLLFRAGRLVYIGSSLDMPKRVASHDANGRPFDEVHYIETSPSKREDVERELIRAFQPPQNRLGYKMRAPVPKLIASNSQTAYN